MYQHSYDMNEVTFLDNRLDANGKHGNTNIDKGVKKNKWYERFYFHANHA